MADITNPKQCGGSITKTTPLGVEVILNSPIFELAKDIEENKYRHEKVWKKKGRITFTETSLYLGLGDEYISYFENIDLSTLNSVYEDVRTLAISKGIQGV